MTSQELLEGFQARTEGTLPGLIGLELVSLEPGRVRARLPLRAELMAPNYYLHAGTIVTMADSCAGMGCMLSLPEGAGGFTTIELKTNFFRSTREDETLLCEATLIHGGQRTQVWDALVTRESDGKKMAAFRCTQFLLPADDPRIEPIPALS